MVPAACDIRSTCPQGRMNSQVVHSKVSCADTVSQSMQSDYTTYTSRAFVTALIHFNYLLQKLRRFRPSGRREQIEPSGSCLASSNEYVEVAAHNEPDQT